MSNRIVQNQLYTIMTIQELKTSLRGSEQKSLSLILPDNTVVPAHFHVTEVGYVKKEFIDCGGKVRLEEKCLLQIWVADDVEHRVSAGKLVEILDHGSPVLPSEDLPIEFEYEFPHVSQFELAALNSDDESVSLIMGNKHTDCLAKDVCGIAPEASDNCCSPSSGCC